MEHKKHLDHCFELAESSVKNGNHPFGSIIVFEGKVVASENEVDSLNDVTAHAEMLAITSASNYIGGKYLIGCTIYVTLEPCAMCIAALKYSQINRIVYGASDTNKKIGFNSKKFLPKNISTSGGILKKESEELLNLFFEKKRNYNNLKLN